MALAHVHLPTEHLPQILFTEDRWINTPGSKKWPKVSYLG